MSEVRRGRKPAIPDEDLRERMFDAAAALLEEQGGLTLSAEAVRFEEVIQRAAVSRSAVYRLWPQKELFLHELLERLASPDWQGTAAFDEETIRLATEVVTSREASLSSAEGRRSTLEETVRVAAAANFRALLRDHRWRTYAALTVTITAIEDPEARDTLLRKLRESDNTFRRRMEEFYQGMAELLHLKPRPPFTDQNAYQMLAVLGASIVEGLALRNLTDETINATTVTREGAEWSIAALGFLSVMDAVFEPA